MAIIKMLSSNSLPMTVEAGGPVSMAGADPGFAAEASAGKRAFIVAGRNLEAQARA
jgi:hypothetical protein